MCENHHHDTKVFEWLPGNCYAVAKVVKVVVCVAIGFYSVS